jgi:hypothetical protein
LFHDANVQEKDFWVGQLWAELKPGEQIARQLNEADRVRAALDGSVAQIAQLARSIRLRDTHDRWSRH